MEDERLIDLETRLVWQEDTLRALNEVVLEQQKRIEHLETVHQALIERIRQLAEILDAGNPPLDERPPHY